jgi:hypothetical protein
VNFCDKVANSLSLLVAKSNLETTPTETSGVASVSLRRTWRCHTLRSLLLGDSATLHSELAHEKVDLKSEFAEL